MLNVNEYINNLSDEIMGSPLHAQLSNPISPVFPGFPNFPSLDGNYVSVVINPVSWKTINSTQLVIEYDASEVEFKNVELDGSGSASISSTVNEAGGVGRASMQISSTGGNGIILYFKPLDGETYTDVVVKNFVINGVSPALTLPAIHGKFLSPSTPSPVIFEKSTFVDVIVDAGVLGSAPLLLKGLSEKTIYRDGFIIGHTIAYGDTVFEYTAIDLLISTVVRDGNFTEEFAKEIADYLPSAAGITYQNAINLVGLPNIDGIVLSVAGADGFFVS